MEPTLEALPITWRIEWQGQSYGWADLTVGHLALIALLSGTDEWESLDPRWIDPTSGYMAAAYMLTAFLAQERVTDGMTDDEAAAVMAQVYAEVSAVKASALADAVHDS